MTESNIVKIGLFNVKDLPKDLEKEVNKLYVNIPPAFFQLSRIELAAEASKPDSGVEKYQKELILGYSITPEANKRLIEESYEKKGETPSFNLRSREIDGENNEIITLHGFIEKLEGEENYKFISVQDYSTPKNYKALFIDGKQFYIVDSPDEIKPTNLTNDPAE